MEPQNTEDNTRGFAFIKAHELPYVDHVPHDGRSIVVKAYYDTDGKQFYAYSLQPNGMLLVLRPMDVIGTYVARSPAKDLDSRLPFSETILHYFSFSEVCHALTRAEQDLLNGLASLHKYFVLLHYSNQNSDYADDLMVRTEVEYAFANHRAFYDCLHEVIRTVHKKYRPESPQLPDSFRKIEEKSEQDLVEKFFFPQPLVNFYKTRKDNFSKLRAIRDNIFHHGHSVDAIYRFPDGFAVSIDDNFANRLGALNLWPDSLLKPNQLGSILAIFEFLVTDMFSVMEHLGNTFLDCFKELPKPIASGYGVFLRSAVAKHIGLLQRYRTEQWLDPMEVLNLIAANSVKP